MIHLVSLLDIRRISLLILLYIILLLFTASGCSTRPQYNNEYLYSAQRLEQGLKEHPDSANKETIKKRIKKLYQLHEKMLKQEEQHRRDAENAEKTDF